MAVPSKDPSISADPQRPEARSPLELVDRVRAGQAKAPGSSERDKDAVELGPSLGR